jgi:hypothetical protein
MDRLQNLLQMFKSCLGNCPLMKLLAALVALILVPAGIGLAAPLPPEMIVNYTTKECSSFFSGDECSDCTPPPGWVRMGPGASCPAGFALVEVEGSCWGLKNDFCCMEGHSGAPGNCTMLAKNDVIKECAFAESLSCSLPAGWLLRPENVSSYEWLCPGDYGWTTVSCTAAGNTSGGCASGNCTSGNITSGNITSGNITSGNSTSSSSTSGKSTSVKSTSGGCPCHG